jgi:hypothetical protein
MPRAKTAFRAEKEHFHTPGQAQQMTEGVFTWHANPKYFLFHLSHRIFERMHGVLNIGKK